MEQERTQKEQGQDKLIRWDYNQCMLGGMSTYAALKQVAKVNATTVEAVRESLERTEFATDE